MDSQNNTNGQIKNAPAIAETVTEEEPLTVFDDETEQVITVDPERQRLARSLQQYYDMTTLIRAVVLRRMMDEKLYLAVDEGYSSFKEYVKMRCGINYRQAQKYVAVGRNLQDILPGEMQSTTSVSELSEGNLGKLSSIGVEKLNYLSSDDEVDLSRVADDGVVTLADGSELDLEEAASKSFRDLQKKNEHLRNLAKDQEAEINRAVKTRDKAIKEKKQMARDAEVGQKYKDMYGQKSTDFEAYKSRLLTARSRAADLNQALSKIKELPADFEALVEELRDLHQQIDRGITHLREDNLESGAFSTLSNHN